MDNVVHLFPAVPKDPDERASTACAIYHCLRSLLIDAKQHELPHTERVLRLALHVVKSEMDESAGEAMQALSGDE
jgi:hypothetical protein